MVRPGRPHRSSAAAAARPSPYALPEPEFADPRATIGNAGGGGGRKSAPPPPAPPTPPPPPPPPIKKKKKKKKTQKPRQQQRQQLRVAPVGFQFKKPHNRRSIEIEPLKAEAEACDRYLEDLDVYHQVFGEYPSSDEHPLPSCVVRYCDRLMALPVAERAQQCRTGVGSHPGFAIARLMVMDRCKAEFTESDAACERQRRLNMADAAAAARQAEEVGPNGETTLTHDRNTEVHKGAGKGQILKAVVWVKKQ